MIASTTSLVLLLVLVLYCLVQVFINVFSDKIVRFSFYYIFTIVMAIVLLCVKSEEFYFCTLFLFSIIYAWKFYAKDFGKGQGYHNPIRTMFVAILVFASHAVLYIGLQYFNQEKILFPLAIFGLDKVNNIYYEMYRHSPFLVFENGFL